MVRRREVPQDEKAAGACRTLMAIGTNKPKLTQHHQVPQITQSTALLHKQNRSLQNSKVSRCTQQGEIPRTDSNSQWSSSTSSSANLTMDKLGWVTELVELNIPTRSVEVWGQHTLKGAPTLQTGSINIIPRQGLSASLFQHGPVSNRSFVQTHHSVQGTLVFSFRKDSLCEK